jgi:hypothetical protein
LTAAHNEDTALVTRITGDLEADAKATSTHSFNPFESKYLPDKCPNCQNAHAHRKDEEGKPTRIPALAITDDGARCGIMPRTLAAGSIDVPGPRPRLPHRRRHRPRRNGITHGYRNFHRQEEQ